MVIWRSFILQISSAGIAYDTSAGGRGGGPGGGAVHPLSPHLSIEQAKARPVSVQWCFSNTWEVICRSSSDVSWLHSHHWEEDCNQSLWEWIRWMTTLFVPRGSWILPTLSNLMTLRSAMEKSFIAGACERSGLRFWSLSLVLLIPTKELVSACFGLLWLPRQSHSSASRA